MNMYKSYSALNWTLQYVVVINYTTIRIYDLID